MTERIVYSMEICILILLYYLSQNPDFTESVKPIMNKLKDSEHMLSFLNDLSKFTQAFGSPPKNRNERKSDEPKKEEPCKKEEKNPQSPTAGIANEFIEQILEKYLDKNVK